jgi:tRNA(adenine34) deaminase
MRLAIAEAVLAGDRGEVPVGAVIMRGATVVSQAGNRREETGDPTAHAEILAIRAAAAAGNRWRLDDMTLYVTLEPCPMCAGALLAARMSRVVFGAPDLKAGACGSLYNLCVDPRLNHELEVVPGVLGEECGDLLSSWFSQRRLQPPAG